MKRFVTDSFSVWMDLLMLSLVQAGLFLETLLELALGQTKQRKVTVAPKVIKYYFDPKVLRFSINFASFCPLRCV